MSWLSKHKSALRIALFVLLTVAIAGPWTYTSDGVPPPDHCRPPNLLLESDRCVRLMSGASILAFAVTGIPSLIAQLVTGAMEFGRIREFLIGLYLLPALPWISTLFVLWQSGSQRVRLAHKILSGVAAGWCLLMILTTPFPVLSQLWGLWLYTGLAIGALLLELYAPVRRQTKE